MSAISFFLMPNEFFNLVSIVSGKHDIKICFRRFKSGDFNAGWRVVSTTEDMEAIYLQEGFSQIYFSIGKLPAHEKDFDFTDYAMSELLEFCGGRVQENILEMSDMRVFAKVSEARKVFDTFKKELGKCTTRGSVMCRDVPCPKIFYSESASRMDMRSSFDGKQYYLRPISSPGSNS